MHILIAHNEYAKPSGEEHALANIAGLFEAEGHRVSWYRRSSAEIGDGLIYHVRAGVAGVWNPFSRRRMGRVLDELMPDVVLAQNLYPLLSPSILGCCSQRQIPVVMRCPNYRLYCPNGLHMTGGEVCEKCLGPGREWWCVRRNCEGSLPKSLGYALRNAAARLSGVIHRNVSVFVVLTEFQKARFMQQGVDEARLVIVPNTAAPPFFDVPSAGGDHVSFMGRVAPEKGIAQFLEIARRLPDIPFEVAGAVKNTAHAHLVNVPPNVTFHGHLTGEELMSFMRGTRIMMSCSLWYEGFPNSIVQAMAASRPVVASRIGAAAEIIRDGETGRLYEPGNLDQAAAHIREVFSDAAASTAMGDAGRRRAIEKYHPEGVYQNLLRALRVAMGRVSEGT